MSQPGDPFDAVLAALTGDKGTEFGLPGARVERLRRIEGTFSTVERVGIHTTTGTTYAYIKLLRPRRPTAEETARVDRLLAREFTATRALHEALRQDRSIGAVRPIACLPEHRALVTEEVPGRPYGELLVDKTRTADELAAVAANVGAWTRIYQSIVEADGRVDLGERRAYLDERLRLLEGRVLSRSDRQAALARFDALAARVGSSTVRAVAIHADLSPLNIIVGPDGRTTLLDFTMAKTGTIVHDIAHLYLHLELIKSRHRRRAAVYGRVQQALLAGYSPSLTPDDPLFRMMLLQHAACHVAMMAERRLPAGADVLYRWFMRRRWRTCERMPVEAARLRLATAT